MIQLDLEVDQPFQPARLRIARTFRGYTKTALAERVGITHAAVSQFEAGRHLPSADRLRELALVLGFPVPFFRERAPGSPASSAFFRRATRTRAADRDRALASTDLATDLYRALGDFVELPTPTHFRWRGASKAAEGAAEAARHARRILGIGRGATPRLARLLEAHGVMVVKNDVIGETVDAFSRRFEIGPMIVLNGRKGDTERTRFDAAHELGHLVMHNDDEVGKPAVERQADAFAAEFLMPAEDIGPLLPAEPDWHALLRLKSEWGVSIAALIRRARDLGVMNEGAYRRANIQRTQMGLRLREPIASDGNETPGLWKQALEVLDGEATFEDIVSTTSIPLHLATEVLGMRAGFVRKRVLPRQPGAVIDVRFG